MIKKKTKPQEINMTYTLDQLKNKYFEYKEILEKIAQGDEATLMNTTVYQAEMMHNIVHELEDQGVHLLFRREIN